MSTFCTECGAQLYANQKFCAACGAAALDSNRPTAAVESRPPAREAVKPAAPAVSGLGSKKWAILVAGVVVASSAVAAALVLIAPKTPQSPPMSSTAAAPSVATPVAVAAPSTLAAPKADPAPAATTPGRWESYINTRYGVVIDYPAELFAIQAPPPDNAGRDFTADKVGARFFLYSHANALDTSLQDLQAEDALDIGDAMAVKNNGPDWYQVTASKQANIILRRVLLSEGRSMVHRLEIAYPKSAAASFEPIVARMIKSFRVDPAIPEKAADVANAAVPAVLPLLATPPSSATPAPPSPLKWQRFKWDTLRIPGYSGKAGLLWEVPVGWNYLKASERREPNQVDFYESETNPEGVLHVTFRAERRAPGATLASEARAIQSRLSEGANNFRVVSQRTTQIASRPAIIFEMQFSGSDKPTLLREDVAIIDDREVFYFIRSGAPEMRWAAISMVFTHAIETLGFPE
jgi:hypothetical protein